MADNIDIVFLKPTKFEDCMICAGYIKADKIVNMTYVSDIKPVDHKDKE